MAAVKRVLLSLTDKTGLTDFASALVDMGCDLISTGGTARVLREHGLPVQDVSEVTGFPEMLDGRVKTIHPRIAGGILARRDLAEHMEALSAHGIPTIDMVVVNLYDFAKVAADAEAPLDELVENIDIGGPTMIRAAAKNWPDVAVVTDTADYPALLEEMMLRKTDLTLQTKWRLAKKAFALTAHYDAAITARFANVEFDGSALPGAGLPESLRIVAPRRQELRYGENPHQKASLYAASAFGIAGGTQLHGKELSYNNLVDLDAAWQLICEFERPAAAIIKHTNPCGCAEQETLAAAYRAAYEADPVSAFGGVLAFNRPLDEETAAEVSKLFVEAIAAPGYSEAALSLLQTKKNLRLLEVRGGVPDEPVVKSITGGFLLQTADLHRLQRSDCKVVTEREPTPEEWTALQFGWRVCKHVKSNAIVYARAGQLIAAGAGQMSRVDSVKVGAMKAVLPLSGCVVASDAFFPFPDGLEAAAGNGAAAFIQPGGSVKDQDVIAAANRLGVAMVFTGVRHFRH
jgi:phosphoribosylaminoimidazolecarboxamide formyltransferase/IMP cyclohydrolase